MKSAWAERKDLFAFRCFHRAWGIGSYTTKDGVELYGFAPGDLDPHRFFPDHGVCTPEEIQRWKEALANEKPVS